MPKCVSFHLHFFTKINSSDQMIQINYSMFCIILHISDSDIIRVVILQVLTYGGLQRPPEHVYNGLPPTLDPLAAL